MNLPTGELDRIVEEAQRIDMSIMNVSGTMYTFMQVPNDDMIDSVEYPGRKQVKDDCPAAKYINYMKYKHGYPCSTYSRGNGESWWLALFIQPKVQCLRTKRTQPPLFESSPRLIN
jgi:hypothetical protein